MTSRKMFNSTLSVIVCTLFLMGGPFVLPAPAGLDSAGVTGGMGSYIEGDLDTNGGSITVDGGGLQGVSTITGSGGIVQVEDTAVLRSGADMDGSWIYDAAGVRAEQAQVGTISNPNAGAVTIADNLNMGASRIDNVKSVALLDINPALASDATSKYYVDKIAANLQQQINNAGGKSEFSNYMTTSASCANAPTQTCYSYSCPTGYVWMSGVYQVSSQSCSGYGSNRSCNTSSSLEGVANGSTVVLTDQRWPNYTGTQYVVISPVSLVCVKP